MKLIKQWVTNVLYALDCTGSAIIFLDRNEPVSSTIGKLELKKVWAIWPLARMIDFIFLVLVQEKSHCKNSILPNEGLFSRNYDGVIEPKNVIRYAIPLQVIGIFVFFNFDYVISLFTPWG